jgi:uncharacterized protein
MRAVIDTNIFISAFFGGKPLEIIRLWKEGKITLCLSKEILEEYILVLERMGLKNETELKELISLFAKSYNLIFTAKTHSLKIVVADPDDDKFIAGALALKAEVIITGDKAILALKEYLGIRIMTPHQFLIEYHRGNK